MHKAFISYSHAADGQFAPTLQSALQKFAKPWHKIRAINVFRDATNLNLSPDLWDTIVRALENSEYFLYLASPDAAASKWVQREINFWLQHKDRSKLLMIVTGGEIAWDEGRGDFDWQRTSCVPPELRGAFDNEPFYLDLRWAREKRDLSRQNPRFNEAIALISATLREQSVEDMIGEEVDQQRRTIRLRNSAIATLAMLLVAAVIAAVVALQQRREAIAQRDLAIQTSSLSQLRNNLNSGSLLAAAQVGWSGYRRFGPRTLVLQGLYEFTSHPTAVIQTLPEPTGARTRVALSPRDDQVLSLTSNADNSFDATLRDWHGTIVGQLLQVADARYSRDGATLVVGRPDAPSYMLNEDGSGCGNEDVHGIAVSARSFALMADGAVGAEIGMPGLGYPVYAADGSAALTVCGNSVYLAGADGATLGMLSVEGASTAGFSPDGGSIVVAGKDGTVLFDRTGRRLGRFAGTKPVFTSDGKRIVTELSDRHSALWEITGREVRRLRGSNPRPGGGGSVLTEANGASLLWLADGSDAIGLAGTGPKVSADGEWIITTLDDTKTLIWDRSGNKLTEVDGVSGQFARRAGVVVTTDPENGTRLWDLSRLSLVSGTAAARLWSIEPSELEEGRFSRRDCLPDCVSPDGSVRLLVGASGNTPGLPMRFTVQPISNEPGSPDTDSTASEGNAATECLGLNTLMFAPTGRGRYLVGCGDGNLYVHGPDGALLRHWQQPSSVNAAVFSADGDRVLSGLDERVAILSSVTTGEEIGRFPGHDGAVTSVAFSPAGDRVATVSSGGILRLWRRSGALLGTFAIPGTRIEAVAFAPDGRYLLSRNSDGSLRRRTIDVDRLLEDYAWLATWPTPVATGQ